MKQTLRILLLALALFPLLASAHNDGLILSLYVTDAETGKVVVNENGDMCLTPASITKLISTATALEILGPDFTFKTTLAYDGKITNGVLNGNIYIIGGGDPTLGSTYLKNTAFLPKWTAEVKKLGIHTINGSIVADASIFERMPIPPGWLWEDLGNYYAAGTFGLSVYDNTLSVTMQTQKNGSKPSVVGIVPEIDGLTIDNQLVAEGSEDRAYFYGMPYSNYRQMLGAVPVNTARFTLKGDIPNPPLLVACHFTDYLKKNGVTVKQLPSDAPVNKAERKVFYTHESPVLSEIIKVTNHRSLNHYAEHITKCLALQRDKMATLNTALDVMKSFWHTRGIDTKTMFILDGSGLSAHAAIPAKTFNEILRYMYTKSKNRQVYWESLPVAGESGTVTSLFKKTVLEKKAHLKSGSMSRVQCYSGYVEYNNRVYIVTVMANNFDSKRSEVRSLIEKKVIDAVTNH